MKNIAGLLALYILVLSFVPCDDILATTINIASDNYFSEQHEEGHSHDSDMCSPFCSCDCCQTEAHQITLSTSFVLENISTDLLITPVLINDKELLHRFWNPPKS